MKKIISWLRQEALLVISWVLAVISMFFVKPDKLYGEYIDWHTIGLLFSLMAVMAGLEKLGFFRSLGEYMLLRVKNKRQLEAVLILLCFFSSMAITNDVALITFVPFSLQVLKMAGLMREVIPVVVMQTIAANLGSMLTPIGNPQNLYLYAQSGMSFFGFIHIMLPYAVISFAMIALFIAGRKNMVLEDALDLERTKIASTKLLAMYGVLFVLCLLTIAKVIELYVLVIVMILSIVIFDRKTLFNVDYTLLLTFMGFFVFVGNMVRTPFFYNAVQSLLNKNDFVTVLGASQVISNVPAVLLLSGFTDKWDTLLVGSNLGGLGTLIASMASLISYKYVVREVPKYTKRYLLYFTLANIIFLGVNLIGYFILK